MKSLKTLISCMLLVCLCLSVLALVGCDDLPIDLGALDGIFGGEQQGTEDVHEHTLTDHAEKAATCTDGGWLAYVTCSTCDYTTYTATEALGHDFAENALQSGDHHSRLCTRCTESVNEAHEWIENGLVKEPDCYNEGTLACVCTVCGAKKFESVAALGHDFSGEYIAKTENHLVSCVRCSETVTAEHEWEETPIICAPTCTLEGVAYYECVYCGEGWSLTIDPLGHDFSNEFTYNDAEHRRECTRCDASIDKELHTYVAGDILLAPTCTDDGEQSYACSVCSATKTEVLLALDHDFSDTYAPNGDVHSLFCSRCDVTVDEAHSFTPGEIITPSTCILEGAQLYGCSACGETKTVILPLSTEHYEGGWETLQMPTATVRGSERLRCALCNEILLVRDIPCDADSMSVLNLTGEYQNATAAKNEVPMQFSLVLTDGTSYEGYAKMKVQGSSSVAYAKKNYTLKLYKDAEFESKNKINVGWGKENKYVIKANWVDFSNARNIVSCRLWGDIVKSRAESERQQRLAGLKTNGGAVDGFPVAVYMNGEFYGLYTFNVPKDEWMFDMGDSETEAILGADDWNHTDFNTFIQSFYEDKNGDIVSKDGGWELIYCGSDDYSWVAESFDALIRFCQENDGEAFRAGIREYLDVDAAIDYIIYMYAVLMRDNASKNMLWITYDGKVWTPSVYDQDGTFGQSWDGVNAAAPTYCLPAIKDGKINPNIPFGPNAHPVNFILWDRILNCFTEEVLLRYQYLRQTTLSVSNMIAELQAFEACVPESIYAADRDKWAADRETWWAGKKGSGVWYEKYHFEYMYQWIENRMANYDNVMRNIYTNVYLPKTENPIL